MTNSIDNSIDDHAKKQQEVLLTLGWSWALVSAAKLRSVASVFGGYAFSYVLRRILEDVNYTSKSGTKFEDSVLTIAPRTIWNKKSLEFDVGQTLDIADKMIGKRGTAIIATALGPVAAIPYCIITFGMLFVKSKDFHDPYAFPALCISAGAAALTGGGAYAPLLATAMCFAVGGVVSAMTGPKTHDNIRIPDNVVKKIDTTVLPAEQLKPPVAAMSR